MCTLSHVFRVKGKCCYLLLKYIFENMYLYFYSRYLYLQHRQSYMPLTVNIIYLFQWPGHLKWVWWDAIDVILLCKTIGLMLHWSKLLTEGILQWGQIQFRHHWDSSGSLLLNNLLCAPLMICVEVFCSEWPAVEVDLRISEPLGPFSSTAA